jgi:hypothetical protein
MRLGGGGGGGREKHVWLENTSSLGKKFTGPLKKECRHARHKHAKTTEKGILFLLKKQLWMVLSGFSKVQDWFLNQCPHL